MFSGWKEALKLYGNKIASTALCNDKERMGVGLSFKT